MPWIINILNAQIPQGSIIQHNITALDGTEGVIWTVLNNIVHYLYAGANNFFQQDSQLRARAKVILHEKKEEWDQ